MRLLKLTGQNHTAVVIWEDVRFYVCDRQLCFCEESAEKDVHLEEALTLNMYGPFKYQIVLN